jgi:hypothetical protein
VPLSADILFAGPLSSHEAAERILQTGEHRLGAHCSDRRWAQSVGDVGRSATDEALLTLRRQRLDRSPRYAHSELTCLRCPKFNRRPRAAD